MPVNMGTPVWSYNPDEVSKVLGMLSVEGGNPGAFQAMVVIGGLEKELMAARRANERLTEMLADARSMNSELREKCKESLIKINKMLEG